jgi:MurNAc alpha-1-phosphate uridylyltransferase
MSAFKLPCLILAAGRGERMRPLTDTLPKPLLTVQGKSLLDWHIQTLKELGLNKIVINHAWLGEKIVSHLGDGNNQGLSIQYSKEAIALETAGGIRTALPLLNAEDYFLVMNGDVFCPHFPMDRILKKVLELRSELSANSPPKTLAHLVLVPNPNHHPNGDFYLKTNLVFNDLEEHADGIETPEKLTFSGIGLYHWTLFKDIPPNTVAKLAPLLIKAISENRVSGEKYLGSWHDVGSPERLKQLNRIDE